MDNDSTETLLKDFFRPGALIEDLPALFPLLRARDALSAFIALFRGGDEEVLIRLLVLREIGHRGEKPTWSPQELRSHFAYLDEVKLQTVLHRLRDKDLLVWDAEASHYQISPHGRMALSALAILLKFDVDEGGEIGYITSQLAASQALGRVADEDLQHLLSRLNELEDEFSRAVLSGSEHRIRGAEKKLNSVLAWVGKGTEILRVIAADPDLDPATHRVAQKIGQVQSRMLRMSSVFQRTLNQLESQKVHLGQSGLSSSDINRWLRLQNVESLCGLLGESLAAAPRSGFLLGDIAMDVAEFELVDRIRAAAADATLPPAQEAPAAAAMPVEEIDLVALGAFVRDLTSIAAAAPLDEAVPAEDFATTSYRMSLVALLGDPESEALEGGVVDLARLPLALRLTGEEVMVGRCEVERMSAGRLERTDESTEE
ncbi:hypothetical protein DESUT3_06300 [Desulfuromonas versatilis]|uniref:DUF3375 domain-containing protein n=1 Tax=Desulfuromonas versatilis TaxID=2802975 RepID=A0ABM8HRJ0_9BACT|nr:hypothetical protein [Desulfuromonas versatilis]BCR03561.1 hypothetical protein DESUT3_06300 [Desulfuromonas versatilis]